jgi:hypothetical protein
VRCIDEEPLEGGSVIWANDAKGIWAPLGRVSVWSLFMPVIPYIVCVMAGSDTKTMATTRGAGASRSDVKVSALQA